MSYNQILDYVNAQDSEDPTAWKFERIIRHQGPLAPNHPDYKGSMYNVELEWENGEITLEPLAIVGADDPVPISRAHEQANEAT